MNLAHLNISQNTPIAFLGMGLMGSRMATRLLQAGFTVAVWNRTKKSCAPLISQGATELQFTHLANYPIILTCLADDSAMDDVFQLIQPYLNNHIIVDFSSLSVGKTQQLAQRITETQSIWIDSPVSGGTIGAEQGSLVIFAGGDENIIRNLQPIYEVLSQRVTRMGNVGAGQATKICNQLIVASTSIIIAEAVALAKQAGVDTQLLAPALQGGFADSKPFQILAPRMSQQQFEPIQWKVKTLAKDLTMALNIADQNNLKLNVSKQALKQLQEHNQQYAEQDLSTLIQHVE